MKRTRLNVLSLVRPDLVGMPPYVPVESADVLAARLGVPVESVLKLDGNENPYGPSQRALDALARERGYHHYPDPEQRAVRTAIGAWLDVPPEMVVCGLGSDDLIDLLLRAVVAPGDGVVNCPPTFGMYPFSTEVVGGRLIDVPRREDWSLDVDAVIAAAADARLIFVASPNNPTGTRTSRKELLALLDAGALVVLDEAYIEFAGVEHSAVKLVAEHDNLVMLRTFSKWAGLAGLRAGYGVMTPALAEVLMRIKQPYNLNVAAASAVLASLEDADALLARAARIVETRERMAEALRSVGWIAPETSEANFLLCRLDGVDAKEVRDRLRERGILVRWFDTPALRQCLRISVGRDEDTERLVTALTEIGGQLGR